MSTNNHNQNENEIQETSEPTGMDSEYARVFANIAAELDQSEQAESDQPVAEQAEDVMSDAVAADSSVSALSDETAVAADDEGTSILDPQDAVLLAAAEAEALAATIEAEDQSAADEIEVTVAMAELKPVIEAVLFVADEPLPFNQLCKILGEIEPGAVKAALQELVDEYNAREGGLELREIAGGWRFSTRPQHHEFIRKYLKSKPSAKLSLPALETLAVIAYRQPVTVPEILEIRGVSSSSAIKTLLEKRLIVTKGRKETVGKPMLYGTSKDFLIQFGLKDLSELPSIEDFEDLAG